MYPAPSPRGDYRLPVPTGDSPAPERGTAERMPGPQMPKAREAIGGACKRWAATQPKSGVWKRAVASGADEGTATTRPMPLQAIVARLESDLKQASSCQHSVSPQTLQH